MYGVSLNNITTADTETKTRLNMFFKDGLKKGIIKPLKKRVFSLRNFNQANDNLQQRSFDEKTLVIVKPEGRSELSTNSLSGYQCQPQSTYIVIGSGGELWLDVAEWLVGRGARRLVLAPTTAHLNTSCAHRLDHLMNLNYARVLLTAAARLGTYEEADSVLDQALRLGPVGGIFFIGLEENSPVISHVDAVSRRLIPELSHFVCLLGGGDSVCQSRAQLGFSSLLVQSEKPLSKPQSILPYLSTVLTDTNSTSYTYLVTDQIAAISNIEETYMTEEDPYIFLPASLEDLLALGGEVSSVPCLREVVTRSPPHWNVKYNMLPFFILPGFSVANLKQFFYHLMHPAYCAPLTCASLSSGSLAQALYEEILQVQKQGPYNIVGETWSGGLAMELATLLESKGHTVELFLLEAAPAMGRHWARALTDKHSLDIALLANLLFLDNQVLKQIGELKSWESQLEVALKFVRLDNILEETASVRARLSKSFTALRNHLTTALNFKPQEQHFKGNVHLLRSKKALDDDFCELEKCCQKKPTVHVVDAESHSEAMRGYDYANILNQNVLYTWDL